MGVSINWGFHSHGGTPIGKISLKIPIVRFSITGGTPISRNGDLQIGRWFNGGEWLDIMNFDDHDHPFLGLLSEKLRTLGKVAVFEP